MAAMFRTLNMPGWLYNIMLIFPIVGVGMLASSTVLALLNVTPSRDQAVANGGLIMLRSLGIFISTAFSTTVLQNIFLTSINLDQYDEQQKQVCEKPYYIQPFKAYLTKLDELDYRNCPSRGRGITFG